jgi:hypothetical protein
MNLRIVPPVDYEQRPQLSDFRETRHVVIGSTFERIENALGSDKALVGYVSFIAGCFFTVGMAWVWAVAS